MSDQVVEPHAAGGAVPSPPCEPACDEAKDALRTLTQEMYERVAKFLHHDKLELEVRLCTIEAKQDKAAAQSGDDAPVYVVPYTDKHRIAVGVSARDFGCLMNHVCSGRATQTAPPPTPRRSHVMDVKDRHGGRHVYALPETNESAAVGDAKAAPQYLSSEAKERLWVEDVVLRGRAYDVRLALSVEKDIDAPPPDVAVQVPRGYRRKKQRVSVDDGSFRYDLTKVRAGDTTSYEVEVEYGSDGQHKLTKDDLYELVRRAVRLASVPELKGQREADVFASRFGNKRGHPRQEGQTSDARLPKRE